MHLLACVVVPAQTVNIFVQRKAKANAFGGCDGKGIRVGNVEQNGLLLVLCPSTAATFRVYVQLTATGNDKISATHLRERLSMVADGTMAFSGKMLHKPIVLTESQKELLAIGDGRQSLPKTGEKSGRTRSSKRISAHKQRFFAHDPASKALLTEAEENSDEGRLKMKTAPSFWDQAVEKAFSEGGDVNLGSEDAVLGLMNLPNGLFGNRTAVNYFQAMRELRQLGLNQQAVIRVLGVLRKAGLLRTLGGGSKGGRSIPPQLELVSATVAGPAHWTN